MSISNEIMQIILEMMDDDGVTEIQRNDLAQTIGCVPSQINYVISSRFTPEQGYIVESRRGGGGYIRITRANFDTGHLLMHVINHVGDMLDENLCRAHISNLRYRALIDETTEKLMLSIASDNCYRSLDPDSRDRTRASIFKKMLLASM